MTVAGVLGALPEGPRYAVLDGARDGRIRGCVLDSRAPAWCLYRGRLPAALEDAAPWLVRIVPGLTDELLRRMWNQSWGILLATRLPSRELRRHLRKFLRVVTDDRRTLLFRYYDPRVLRAFLPTCSPQQIAELMGPISAFAAEAEEEGAFHLFRSSEGTLEHRLLRC